jgi:hypothetical protein
MYPDGQKRDPNRRNDPMNLNTFNAVTDDELSDVCIDKQRLLEELPALQAQLDTLEALDKAEAQQWTALTQQHLERRAAMAKERQGILSRIGRCRAAEGWLRAHVGEEVEAISIDLSNPFADSFAPSNMQPNGCLSDRPTTSVSDR